MLERISNNYYKFNDDLDYANIKKVYNKTNIITEDWKPVWQEVVT